MDEQTAVAERRRALLVKVVAAIAALESFGVRFALKLAMEVSLPVAMTAIGTLRAIREHAEGALAGDLEDDGAWAELLTMMLQEVADGSDECAH